MADGAVRVGGRAVDGPLDAGGRGRRARGRRRPTRPRAAGPWRPTPRSTCRSSTRTTTSSWSTSRPALVVHPGAGNADGHPGRTACWPASPSWPAVGDPSRPGIVHRLDKGTSACWSWPARQAAYARPGRRSSPPATVERRYLALVWGHPDAADGRGRRPDRALAAATRPAWRCRAEGREARTRYEVEQRFTDAGRRPPCSSAGWRRGAPTRSGCTWPPSATRWWATAATAARRPVAARRPARSSTPPASPSPTRAPASASSSTVAAARRPRGRPGRALTLERLRRGSSDAGAGRRGPAGPGAERLSGRLGDRPGRCPGPERDAVGQGVGVEVAAHVLADVGPDGQQHALALVVAGAVLVGLAEVADHDRPVDGADDLAEGDLLRVAGQHVAAADAPLRAHQPGALEGQQDLLEVGLGEAGALGDVAHRRGPLWSRAAPATAAPGWRSRRGSTPSHAPWYGARASVGWRRPPARCGPATRWTSTVTPRTTAARACQRRAGAARAGADAARPGCRPPAVERRPGRAARCSTAWAGSSSRPAGHLAPTLAAMAGGPITHGGPVHHGHRPHLARPRAARPASTAWSATGSTSGGDVLNVLRWRTPAGDARTVDPAGPVPGPARLPRPPAAGGHPGRVRRHRLHRRPPRRRPLPGWRMPSTWSRGAPALLRPASRSSTPTTTASTRSPTSTGSASTTTPSCAAADRLVADLLAVLPAGAALVVTSDHGQVHVGDAIVAHPRRRHGPRSSCSVGRGPVPLAPRPARRRADARRRRPRVPRRPGLGAHAGRRSIDEGWFGPRVSRGGRRPPRRRGPRRHRPRRLRATRPTPARTGWSARHGSLTSAEMLVPLLASPGLTRGTEGAWTQEAPHPTPPSTSSRPSSDAAAERREVGAASDGGPCARRRGRPTAERRRESVEHPAKVMRIGSMIKQLLDEVRPGAARRRRAGSGCARSTRRRSGSWPSALSPDLQDELARLALPFDADDADRGRAADRPGPAGGLARGPLPRHPGHAVRPADGGPPAARADAAPARPPPRACRAAPAARRPPTRARHLSLSCGRSDLRSSVARPVRNRQSVY